jgi:diguanylate cyclase (GGDEF)-like protein
MAASEPNPRSDRPPAGGTDCLTSVALRERLEEEISRAERHGTGLSCLLVVIEDLEDISLEHGPELREQTITYVAGVLRRELRRFDRIGRDDRVSANELLIVLPGADSTRGEIVARRALERLRTIKVEARGTRQPLHISVGLAAWRESVSAEALLASARAALRSVNGEERGAALEHATPAADRPTERTSAHTHDSPPPAVGRAGGS